MSLGLYTARMSTSRQIEILNHRIAWATKYGEAAFNRDDRKVASTFSKIANDARAELEKVQG